MTPANPPVRTPLFLLGFLTLFLELVLIRYLPGSIWNMGYFPNLVLLAVFIGMGTGFVFHQHVSATRSPVLFTSASVLLLALVAFIDVARPSVPGFHEWSGHVGGELYFTSTPQSVNRARLTAAGLFAACFFVIATVFAFLAQRTAKVFRTFTPLRAYTLDIAGSCAGIVAFMAVSYWQLPAWAWFVALAPLFVLADEGRSARRLLPVVALGLVALLAWKQDRHLTKDPAYAGPLETRWSPYQKVEVAGEPGSHAIVYVNGIGHQEIWTKGELPGTFYVVPYELRKRRPDLPAYKNVLVIGAGAGNDVAAALMNGADHVDAVEIDPVIAGVGQRYNALAPYADPRVTLVVDDGRAFMMRTRRRYDLVIFALTDSLVRVSSMAQLRLENFLFTRQSIARAYALLSEHGDVVLYNYYRYPWLGEKLQQMMREATGKYPRQVYQDGDFFMYAVGRAEPGEQTPRFTEGNISIAVDDWPFPYLRVRGIPSLYAVAMALLGATIAVVMIVLQKTGRAEGGRGSLAVKLGFAFMGVAFLLLETKSVVQFSLLFGTTWLNSSLVFLAVLLLVLAANWAAVAVPRSRLNLVYGALLASCLVSFVYPLANLLALESTVLRFVIGSLLTFLPIFFANLIFSITFRDQPAPEHVFGWNLVGAALGGVMEYCSMAFGYTALALIVAACYTVALLLVARSAAADTARAHLTA
jgi:Spermine/spermidine synthase domain